MNRKIRRNSLTKLASRAFADQDRLLLKEMRKAQERYDFEAAALALSEWTGRGHEEMRAHGLRIIADYVRSTFTDAAEALKWLIKQSRRLGVWCACACAREALKYVPKGEDRPRIAIETAENWVRGKATKNQVKKASDAAWTYVASGYAAAAAAAAAADAAWAADAATACAARAAANAASAAAAARKKELQRLGVALFTDDPVFACFSLFTFGARTDTSKIDITNSCVR